MKEEVQEGNQGQAPKRRKKKPRLIGSTSYGFLEGHRSEYLAHYLFSSFGTSVPVPGPQDTGIDLYCTLAERIGQRIWPRAYFSVQVKSIPDPWMFESPDSIKWLLDNPLPLFLCVVEKKHLRFRIYHTFVRFYVQAHPPLPSRLELIPEEGPEGRSTQYKDGVHFGLSAPILEFTLEETLSDGCRATVRDVLQFWIETDLDNLQRKRNGVLNFKMPNRYATNKQGAVGGWCIQGSNYADKAHLDRAVKSLREPLDWVSDQLYKNGDLLSSVRGMLLLQQLYWDEYHSPASLGHDIQDIRRLIGPWGIDQLGSAIDATLINALDKPVQLGQVRRLCLNGAQLTPNGLSSLQQATRLERLDLSNADIDDNGIKSLERLSELRTLHLHGTRLTDKGLVSLAGLSHLEILGLRDTQITDEGLSHLKGLMKLQNLYLNNTRLNGSGLRWLKGLAELDVITLSDTAVTDEALEHLQDLPKLRRVELTRTNVTPERATALQEELARRCAARENSSASQP